MQTYNITVRYSKEDGLHYVSITWFDDSDEIVKQQTICISVDELMQLNVDPVDMILISHPHLSKAEAEEIVKKVFGNNMEMC